MNPKTNSARTWLMLGTGIVCIAIALNAQVKTQTSESAQPSTVQTTVERGEVVTVTGNDLVVKMEDGSLRHFPNVPESARVNVDGKELGISRSETWHEAPADHHYHDNS